VNATPKESGRWPVERLAFYLFEIWKESPPADDSCHAYPQVKVDYFIIE
jgi:hypothetical protein